MQTRLREIRDFCGRALLEDYLPFWVRHAPDREFGGYFTCLHRDGGVYDQDKMCMWAQGRIAWTFAHLFNEFDQRPEWLDMARLGVEFILGHGFAEDGSMYYALTRDGRPLVPSQDVFTELSAVCGLTEYARATEDETLRARAHEILMGVWERLRRPGRAGQPFLAQTRPVRLHGHSMITLNVIQELRRFREEPEYESMIDECVYNMRKYHLRPERRCLLELVEWEGADLPGSLGRWINPGHMIEGGIFLIHEGRRREDGDLKAFGLDLIDWGFDRGWDTKHGGVFNDVDEKGLPIPTAKALLAGSKLWWQHAEAFYGLALAFGETGRRGFLDKFERVNDYCLARFADPEHGEWFAMLDHRGDRINDAKGTERKNTYHLVRNVFNCYREMERLLG